MRRPHTAITTLALLALTACTAVNNGTDDKGTGPGYTVRNKAERNHTGSADLIIPSITKHKARAAIRDYAEHIDGQELYYLKAMKREDAPRYVCRARWYKDAKAYAAYSDHAEQPHAWPHLAINCP